MPSNLKSLSCAHKHRFQTPANSTDDNKIERKESACTIISIESTVLLYISLLITMNLHGYTHVGHHPPVSHLTGRVFHDH